MALSFFGAGAMIVGAHYLSGGFDAAPTPATLGSGQPSTTYATDWEATLYAIQGNNASSSLPALPPIETVQALLASASSSNITDTVSRSLLVNLTTAASQGMGDDIPTQQSLIDQALAQIQSRSNTAAYTATDIRTVPDSTDASREYGNIVMQRMAAHSDANAQAALLAIGLATDNNDASQKVRLEKSAVAYTALAEDLLVVPTPRSLAPIHLEIVNNFMLMAVAANDMAMVLEDPLRGLSGMGRFQVLTDSQVRLFTNIAQIFARGGILFSTSEPGAVWDQLLHSY